MDSPSHHGEKGAVDVARRVYLGNVPYATSPNEIEDALRDHRFGNFEHIHMSINSAGSNPGYCFVDFDDPKTAESAIKSLSLVMKIHGRVIKVGPCQPKQNSQRSDRLVDRWGSSRDSSNYNNNNNNNNGNSEGSRWSELKKGTDGRNSDSRSSTQYNNGNGNGTRDQPSGKRLYIGNLGPVRDEEQDQQEISKLLEDLELDLKPLTIGNRIAALDRETNKATGHTFCFVEFATAEEARKAIDALNGKAHGAVGNTLRVSIARGAAEGGRTGYRQHNNYNNDRNGDGNRDGNNNSNGHRKRQTADDAPPRALGSNNWRRKD